MKNEIRSISIKRDVRTDKEEDLFCIQCGRTTSHKVLSSIDLEFAEPDLPERSLRSADILSCSRCHEISFKDKEEFVDNAEITCTGPPAQIYPLRQDFIISRCIEGKDVTEYTFEILEMYYQTIQAIYSGSFLLAAVGMRAIAEEVCRFLKAPHKDLSCMIHILKSKKTITSKIADKLHFLRKLGNKAAHKGKPPSREHIIKAMEFVGQLLYEVYVLKKKKSILSSTC